MSHRLLVKDNVGERELLLIDSIVIGRDPRCDISESDPQLSRRHAEFSVSDRGVVVRDLNSRNGMLVNGKKVLEAILHPGDVVQVANLAVTFVRAGAEPEAVSMPAPAAAPSFRPAAPQKSKRLARPQPVLPFRLSPDEDDRTGLMSPDQVAAAAIASLPERGTESSEQAKTAAGVSLDPATVGLAPDADGEVSDPPEPSWPPPSGTGAGGRRDEDQIPAIAAGPLVSKARAPITGVAEPGWTASLTWQVATLAIVSFLIGALSALPWRAGPVGGAALTAAMILLLPLVTLLLSLGLGLLVAARVRRATLARLSAFAAQVRKAAEGEIDRVADPLGSGPSAELADAINDVLGRAGRP